MKIDIIVRSQIYRYSLLILFSIGANSSAQGVHWFAISFNQIDNMP